MISSIFGKTKPISNILLLSFLLVFYWAVHFFLFKTDFSTNILLLHCVFITVLLLTLILINFIVSKNKITGLNTYAILIYCLFIVVFPEVVAFGSIICSSFFLLLALRRLISLKSLQDVKNKIFDASFWIAIASLFYDWAILFLIVVVVAIYLYQPKNYKNWFVMLVALFAFSIILWAGLLVTGQENFVAEHYVFSFSLEYDFLYAWENYAKLLVYILTMVFMGLYSLFKMGKVGPGRLITLRFLGVAFLVGLLCMLFSDDDGISPLLFTFLPAAVFCTNYIESIKKKNLRELLLLLSFILPLGMLVWSFFKISIL